MSVYMILGILFAFFNIFNFFGAIIGAGGFNMFYLMFGGSGSYRIATNTVSGYATVSYSFHVSPGMLTVFIFQLIIMIVCIALIVSMSKENLEGMKVLAIILIILVLLNTTLTLSISSLAPVPFIGLGPALYAIFGLFSTIFFIIGLTKYKEEAHIADTKTRFDVLRDRYKKLAELGYIHYYEYEEAMKKIDEDESASKAEK